MAKQPFLLLSFNTHKYIQCTLIEEAQKLESITDLRIVKGLMPLQLEAACISKTSLSFVVERMVNLPDQGTAHQCREVKWDATIPLRMQRRHV